MMKNTDYKRKYFDMRVRYIVICLLLVATIGVILNWTAMVNNKLKMPVYYDSDWTYESENHFSYNDPSQVKYPILSDIFEIGDSIYSIGDLTMFFASGLLALFLFGLFLNNIVFNDKKFKSNKFLKRVYEPSKQSSFLILFPKK